MNFKEQWFVPKCEWSIVSQLMMTSLEIRHIQKLVFLKVFVLYFLA